MKEREAQILVSDPEQEAIGQNLPPGAPGFGKRLAHQEAAAAEHHDSQQHDRDRHRPTLS